METSVGVILKKTFSLALIFNALITIAGVTGIIFGYYRAYPYWQPYAPWLLNGNLFWLALAAAIPSKGVGVGASAASVLEQAAVVALFC